MAVSAVTPSSESTEQRANYHGPRPMDLAFHISCPTSCSMLPKTTRLMIVDDHEMVRTALASFLGDVPGFQVVAVASSIRDGGPLLELRRPDILVADLSLEDGNGTEFLRTIRREGLSTHVVIITGFQDEFAALHALRAGVSGYVHKTQSATELVEAIRAVLRSERYVPPALASLLTDGSRNDRLTKLCTLSQREAEVFRLAAIGRTSSEIGRQLFISTKTV